VAKFRLKIAHQMRNTVFNSDVWLPGDKENESFGDDRGTLVGDGTPYVVTDATIEMVPLDAEAEEMIRREEARLARNGGSMNPVDQLSTVMQALTQRDDYEARYVPGFPGHQRPQPQGPGPTRPTVVPKG
jgi:hypothetical protein